MYKNPANHLHRDTAWRPLQSQNARSFMRLSLSVLCCVVAVSSEDKCLSLNLAVGIGPGKSGSTALAMILMRHGGATVEVGSSALGNQSCCGAELHYFNRVGHEPDCEEFSRFFATPFSEQPHMWRFEKTPSYSSHTMTPFYLRTMSRNVKLLFTYRSPVLLDVSLHRHLKSTAPYNEWFDARRQAHERYLKCRGDGYRPRDSLTEVALDNKCGQGEPRPWMSPPFKNILTGHSIRRWAHVFPRSDIMCIAQKEMYNTARTIRRLNSFLGVSMILSVDNINKSLPSLADTSAEATDQERYDLEKYEQYEAIIRASYKSNDSENNMSIAQYAKIIVQYDLPDEVAKVCYNR